MFYSSVRAYHMKAQLLMWYISVLMLLSKLTSFIKVCKCALLVFISHHIVRNFETIIRSLWKSNALCHK